ncbi:MAG: polysaccharide biosynthesis C-terminal domain-containing protein [Candidatus Limnocylindria bacterium]
MTLVVLGKVGMEHANIYLLGSLRIAPERLARQNLVVALMAGLPGAILLILMPSLLPDVFGDVPFEFLAVASATIPLMLHFQLAAGLQNLSGLVTWQFRALVVGAGIHLAVLAALWLLGQLDVLAALAVNLMAILLTYLIVISRDWSWLLTLRVDGSLLLLSLRYSLFVHIGMVLLFFQMRVTMFIVQALIGTAPLGHFSLAVALAESLALASDSLAIALLPRQTSAALRQAATLSLRLAMLGGVLVAATALPLVLLGPRLIEFAFGSEFSESYVPFVALLPGIVFFAMQRFCGAPTLRANDPGRFVRIFIIGVAVNISLNLFWIPEWGLLGAAGATSVSYAITAILFLRWTRQLSRADAVDG